MALIVCSLIKDDSIYLLSDHSALLLHIVPYLSFLHAYNMRLSHLLLLNAHHLTLIECLIFAHFAFHQMLHHTAVNVIALLFVNRV